MPNLTGILNSVRKTGRRGDSFAVRVDGQEVYAFNGYPSEKKRKFLEYQKMLGERVIVVYDEFKVPFLSAERLAAFLAGVFGFGKKPVRYREIREIMTETTYLKEPIKDIFD